MGLSPALPTDQFDFLETIDCRLSTIGSAAWPTANLAVLVTLPRRASPLVIATANVFVATASGYIDIGIYSFDGTTYSRLASTGATAMSGTNAYQSLALVYTLQPNPSASSPLYVAAVAIDNTTGAIYRAGASASAVTALDNRVKTIGTSFPLPTSIPLAGTSNGANTPFVRFRP